MNFSQTESDSMGTESTPEYKLLYDTHLATERGVNTDQIIGALSEDPNQAPYKVLTYVKEQGFLISISEDPTLPNNLQANFIDNVNTPHGSILLARTENKEDAARHFKIEDKTFNTLTSLIIDPDVAKANVETKLGHAR